MCWISPPTTRRWADDWGRMTSASLPVLETARLTLRPQRLEDFASVAAIWSAPEVYRHILGRPSTHQESWFRLLRNVGHWHLMGFGYWAVVDRTDGAYLGEVGFANQERAITPSLAGIAEAGWTLAPAAHGRGIATEALTEALRWADEVQRWERTACIISGENTASLRVADKTGYRHWTTGEVEGKPIELFQRMRRG